MTKTMTEHPQVHIQVGDGEADVDEQIASLIVELWKADIETTMSCQNYVRGNEPGVIWIHFWSADDAELFLDIVGRYEPGVESLYNRIAQVAFDEAGTVVFWEYDVSVSDLSLELLFDLHFPRSSEC